jgi:low molecular weight protein-tyrosine phosphatase
MVKVLFVCMGNICRSPTAEGVFRAQVLASPFADKIHIDSAGTHSYQVGSSPDKRSQRAARHRGVDLSKIRARRVVDEDFAQFDYILPMDRANLAYLLDLSPDMYLKRIKLFLDFAPQNTQDEVPDPYYGGVSGFNRVLDLVEDASRGLLAHIELNHFK